MREYTTVIRQGPLLYQTMIPIILWIPSKLTLATPWLIAILSMKLKIPLKKSKQMKRVVLPALSKYCQKKTELLQWRIACIRHCGELLYRHRRLCKLSRMQLSNSPSRDSICSHCMDWLRGQLFRNFVWCQICAILGGTWDLCCNHCCSERRLETFLQLNEDTCEGIEDISNNVTFVFVSHKIIVLTIYVDVGQSQKAQRWQFKHRSWPWH